MTNRARPLADWVAIEPIFQGQEHTFDAWFGLWLPLTRKAWNDSVHGLVLAVGPRVRPEIQPGMEIVYQRFSGHPHQWDPLPAELFGGAPGHFAALVRIVDAPCIEDREAVLDGYRKAVSNLESLAGVVDEASEPRRLMLLDHFHREADRARSSLKGGLRTSRHHPIEATWSVGRGIEAVVERSG